jgi:nicotinate-nucleotide adenylyltransferase
MATWRRLDDTRELATVVVIERAGEHAVPPGSGWRVEHLVIPRLDVSSTEVRERLERGFPVAGLVPAAVVRLIRERGLYASRS